MAKNMTFSVSLKLLTKNFQNGIKSIQNSLGRLRQQFSTLMGGIGLGMGLKELVEQAKSLDKAQTTLRNVSNTAEAYGENMKFLQGLAKRYNQDIIVLMGNFAKFHSAAAYANMSLEDQQHIYESLTRASAYFNLTADETNGVMLAIQQMISKGRVSSEELRRQLGERLPGAMNLAAKAAGKAGITANGTTAELEDMIKKGRVLAVDLLPALATELNELTKNLDVNTIQGATNKLQNAFTDLVQKLDVGGIYKKFLNALSNGLEYLGDNLRNIATSITTVLSAIMLKGGMQKGWNAWNNFFKKIDDSLKKSQTNLKIFKKELDVLSNDKGVKYTTNSKTGRIGVNPADNIGVDPQSLREAQEAAKRYNRELRQSSVLQDQLNHKTKTMGTHIWANVKGFLKMAGVQAIFYGISYLLSDIVIKTISWRKEQNRVKNLVKDTMDELNTEIKTPGQQETELWNLKMAAFDTHSYDADRKKIVDSINRILGTQFDVETSNYEINKAVNERLKLLKEERIYQTNNAKLAELREQKEKKLAEIQRKREEVAEKEAKKKQYANMGSGYSTIRAGYTKEINTLKKEIGLFEAEVENLTTAIEQITKDNEPYLRNLGPRQKALEGSEITNDDFSNEEEEETLSEKYLKIKKEYNDNLRSLNEQKKYQLLTEEEYNKALGELEVKTAEAILALDDVNEATDKFAAARVAAAQQYLLSKEKEDKVQNALTEYYTNSLALADQLDAGIISQEEYESALQSLKEEALKQLLAMGELTDSAQELADMYKQKKDYDSNKEAYDLVNSELPTLGSRDTTFDYKKEDSEKFGEMAEIYEEYVDGLNALIEKIETIQKENPTERNADMLEELNMLLEQASQNADSFEEASKFAQVQEDVKNLKAELAEGIFDNISNIATAAERLTNSWKTLTETMDDPDASGWEKFITIFTTIMSVIETVVGVVKAFQAVMAVAETLSLATAAAEQAGIPVKVQDAIATQAQAAAAKQLAIARHMSAAASVPYPANIAAIGTTAGALAAAFAALPAFAEGGIVRGASSVGDRNLVRVNAGEAILTKMQQANLWHLLNGQGALLGKSVGGNVEFKIRGADLVGTINNYSKKISK